MKKVINNNVGKITFLFSLLTFLSVTKFWWLSIFSLIYYIWNLFYHKKILLTSTVLFSLNILLLIINFAIIKPTNKWAEKVQAK
jgi:hypothetical protein